MRIEAWRKGVLAGALAATAGVGHAQTAAVRGTAHDMPGMAPDADVAPAHNMSAMPSMGHDMGAMPGMADGGMTMHAMLGPYPMARESSGTSWQPDSVPMNMLMFGAGGLSLMAEGHVTGIYDRQGGGRGGGEAFSQSMAMLMANRPLGEYGTLGLRAMLSLDPLMGRNGYPLLFATGETADGVHHLTDRQHPHDLFMEVAGSYAYDVGGGRAVSLYAGLPGEPALGPPAFMHRVSAMDDPEAPIGHHWFDSTHITYGVLTAGFSTGRWKIEASAFKGREPDQHRWDIETPKLDSWSVRAFFNPSANLSLQASTGHLRSPEQIEPDQNEQRTTASASWNLPLAHGINWASTVAWSLKDARPGPALNGWLAETSLRLPGRNTLYARAEREQENELFDDGDPFAGRMFTVNKLSVGYQHGFPVGRSVQLVLGGLVSAYVYPRALEPAYGADGVKSFMLYTRLVLGR